MKKTIYTLFVLIFALGYQAMAQLPVVTVRFANPQFDCDTETYCLDVEFLSDSPDVQVFGMNVRFFFDDDILEFLSMGEFAGGYGPVSPSPPSISIGSQNSGSTLFSMEGAAVFLNGAIQLVNQNAGPVYLSDTEWTKLFNICFKVKDPASLNNPEFCPSVVWDLEEDPQNGGFLTGSNGVVITVVAPSPLDSSPTTENVVHHNWSYSSTAGFPFGFGVQTNCISTVCEVLTPDISITKTADPNTYSAVGDLITYTIEVINTGETDLTNVLVTDPLTGLNTIIPNLIPGEKHTFTESYSITQSDVQAGMVINVANAIGQDPEGNPVSDSAEETITLDPPDFPALVITKHTDSNLVYPGDEVIFYMTVTNYGLGMATNVVAQDTLSDGFIFSSASNGGSYDPTNHLVTWDLGNLDTDESVTIELRVIVKDGVLSGTPITNKAHAIADNADPAFSCEAKVIVIGEADLMITKSSDEHEVYAGDHITYTLDITNLGMSDAVNILIRDQLPHEVEFVSASHNATYNSATHSIEWTFDGLENGSMLSVTIVVRLHPDTPEGRTILNHASVMSDTYDPNPLNNTAVHILTVAEHKADLRIAKSVDQTSVPAGESIEYTLTVTNNGPDHAINVVVTDSLPEGVLFIEANEGGIHNASDNSVVWTFSQMIPGETIILTLVAQVPAGTTGGTILINNATVSNETTDPDLSNNNASVAVEVQIPDLFIPEVFSPNADGINDKFEILGLERYPNNSIIIINRWGNKVFEAAPYNNDWDGTNQFGITIGGNQLPAGTYYYILNLGDAENKPIRGFIYLTR